MSTEKKPKTVNLTQKMRGDLAEQILKKLFLKRTNALQQEANDFAQGIVNRVHATFFELKKDKNASRYLLDLQRDAVFTYDDRNGNAVHFGVPSMHWGGGWPSPVCMKFDKSELSRYYHAAGHIARVQSPARQYRSEAMSVGRLSEKELAAIAAFEASGTELVAQFESAKTDVMAALTSCRTVAKFSEQYPDLAALCTLPEPEVTTTALAPRNEDIVKGLTKAGLLPIEEAVAA